MTLDREAASVFVNWVDADEDYWTGTWQRGSQHREFNGTREETLAWARAQEAEHRFIFDGAAFVPLPDAAGAGAEAERF